MHADIFLKRYSFQRGKFKTCSQWIPSSRENRLQAISKERFLAKIKAEPIFNPRFQRGRPQVPAQPMPLGYILKYVEDLKEGDTAAFYEPMADWAHPAFGGAGRLF